MVTVSWWKMTLVSSMTYQLYRQLQNRSLFSPELLWYLGRHPRGKDDSELAAVETPDSPREPCVGGHAMEIEQLLDIDRRQASTQTEPVDSPSSELSSGDTSEDSSEDGLISLPDAVKQRRLKRQTLCSKTDRPL